MPDIATNTGSREDLRIDGSRCLRMRYSESGCRRCVEICPHMAVSLENGLAIDADHCRGCLLCTVTCPVGALEHNNDLDDILKRLLLVPGPVLGCARTKAISNASMTCLGGLSDEHLLTLNHSLSNQLILNTSLCVSCDNKAAVQHLKQRLNCLSQFGLFKGDCQIVAAESVADVHYCEETLDRRSFFTSLSRTLFKSASALVFTSGEHIDSKLEYSGKRIPVRRQLLNKLIDRLTDEYKIPVQQNYNHRITFSDSCTTCQGCVAACPTGALQTKNESLPPCFEQLGCTGCGLCVEFCMDGFVCLGDAESKGIIQCGTKKISP